eukprot:EC118315.1.p1 GENE.EC118315.1~~EC118315.1.p1  ORF type:complete len:112 (-),score=3.10 EC118315.1:86-421(-)
MKVMNPTTIAKQHRTPRFLAIAPQKPKHENRRTNTPTATRAPGVQALPKPFARAAAAKLSISNPPTIVKNVNILRIPPEGEHPVFTSCRESLTLLICQILSQEQRRGASRI